MTDEIGPYDAVEVVSVPDPAFDFLIGKIGVFYGWEDGKAVVRFEWDEGESWADDNDFFFSPEEVKYVDIFGPDDDDDCNEESAK